VNWDFEKNLTAEWSLNDQRDFPNRPMATKHIPTTGSGKAR